MTQPGPGRLDPQRHLGRLRTHLPGARAAAVRDTVLLDVEVHPAPPGERDPLCPPPPTGSPDWHPLAAGDRWGRRGPIGIWGVPLDGGQVVWLRARLEVPAAWSGRNRAAGADGDDAADDLLLRLDDPRSVQLGEGCSLEALAYLDGTELGGFDDQHPTVRLPDAVRDGRPHEVLVRVTLADERPFRGLGLQRRHRGLWRWATTALFLLEVVEALPATSRERGRLLDALTAGWRTLRLRDGWSSDALLASVPAAQAALNAVGQQESGEEPPDDARGDEMHRVVASGHAHLDVAWLWPFWRTRQKAVHTVATALRLMETDPDYHFSMSAPQVWAWVKADAPALWERMRAAVARGRLEPVGAFWLESDCNLPSGESFVRQLRHGLEFFERELRASPRVAFLPDSFGFSAGLPQLLRSAGVEVLVTTKLSWSRVDRMPQDTFSWVGLDGTSVVAHFVTTSSAPVPHPADTAWHTYTGRLSPAETTGIWAHYRSKDLNPELLLLFGMGDGGGGPTEEMLAALEGHRRYPVLADVRPGRVDDWADALVARVRGDDRLAEWVGDLYLEGHLGTYTSQADVKRRNRAAEHALCEAELLCAWAAVLGGPDRQPELDPLWETVLRHQFHDVLPGSSIGVVYEDVRRESDAVLASARAVADAALAEVVGAPDRAADADRDGALVLNPLGWTRTGVVDVDGTPCRVQVPGFAVAAVPSCGTDPDRPVTLVATPDGWTLANGLLTARVDRAGEVVSLRTEAGREVVAGGGSANRLVLFEDRPVSWDAWDIDPYYPDKPLRLADLGTADVVVEDGTPWRASLTVTRSTGRTSLRQTYRLVAGADRLDVETHVDWHEDQMLLRALFDWRTNAPHATVGRQFGSIEVPTHRNTSWEQARYELAAHGFLDVADADAGVTLLTDAVYGHSVVRSTVGLSLLKSAAWPDPTADRGEHTLRYALRPHDGRFDGLAAARAAAELARPLRVVPGARPARPLLTVTGGSAVAETVKPAWDGAGVVVRVWEASGGATQVSLAAGPGVPVVREAWRCDVRERPLAPLAVEPDGSATLPLRPFEVATVRLRLGGAGPAATP